MMKKLSRFLFGTLRGRLIISVALVHAVMMSLFIADLTTRQRDMLLDRQIDEASALSQALATSAAGWIVADDVSGLQELVDAQNIYPEIIFAALVNKDGRVLANTDKSTLGQYMLDLPREANMTIISSTPSLVDVAVPAMLGGRHVGWARVGIGQEVASKKLVEITRSGIIYALAAILVGSGFAWIMGGRISRRLYAIQETIDVVRSGNRMARSVIGGVDEAALMAHEFNSMLDALAERDVELRDSEEKYRALIHKVQAAIVLHNGQGRILSSNPLAQELLGLSEDQLLGKTLIDPDWHFLRDDGSIMPISEYPVSRVIATKQPLRGYVAGVHNPDQDEIKWVLISAEPEYNQAGAIEQIIVSFIDITDRKRVEEALRKSMQEIQDLYDHAPCGYHSLDCQGEVIRINDTELNWLGYTREEIVGRKNFSDLVTESSLQVFKDNFTLLKERGWVRDLEFELIRKDGTLLPVLVSSTGIYDDDGHYLKSRSTVYDITERRKADEALKKSEQELRAFFSQSIDGCFYMMLDEPARWDEAVNKEEVLDYVFAHQRITQINDAMLAQYGATREQMLNLTPNDFFEHNIKHGRDLWRRFFDTGKLILESDERKMDGTPIWIEGEYIAFHDSQGRIMGHFGIQRDITERKRTEKELQERERHSQSLLHLSRSLERAQSYTEVLDTAQNEVRKAIGYQNLWIYLLSEDKKYFKSLVAGGPTSDTVMSEDGTATLVIEGDKMLEEIAGAKEIVIVEDAQTDDRVNKEIVTQLGVRTIVNVPIILMDRHLGSVGTGTFGDEGVHLPTESEQKYLSALASHMAAALDRLHLLIRRKQAERALKESEEKYRVLSETSTDIILTHDLKGRVAYINQSGLRITECSEADLIGASIATILPSAELAEMDKRAKARLHGETGTYQYETKIISKSGKYVPVEVHSTSIVKEDQSIEILINARDITDRKQAEEAMRRLNRELRAISNCNQVLMRAVDEDALLSDICHIICDEAGYCMAWVGYAEDDAAKTVRPVAWAGTEDGYLAAAGITWDDSERGRGPTGTAIRSGESSCIQDFTIDPRVATWRDSAIQRGYRSSIALPLKGESANTFGVLNIYSTESNAFTPDEMRLLEELAGDLAFGIVVLRTRTERKRAEETLHYLASIVQSSDDAITAKTLDGIITSWNKGAEKIYGYTEGEMIGKPISMLIPSDREGEIQLILEKIKWGEHIEHYETIRRRKDGRQIDMSLTISSIKDEEGRIIGVSTIGRDITERKQAEEVLRMSEARLNEAQRIAHIGSWQLDIVNNILTWSDEIYRMFEIDRERFGASYDAFLDAIHPDDREAVNFAYTNSIGTRTPYNIEHRLRFADGRIKYVHEQCETLYDADGKPIRSFGTVQDITERKQAEEALRAASSYNRRLIEASLDPLVTIGPDGKITDVNKATEVVTGVLRERLIGDDFSNYFTEPDKARDGYQKVLAEGMVRDYPLTIRHASGKTTDVLYNATVYRNEAEEVQGVFAAARDITERKRAEEELRVSEEKFRAIIEQSSEGVALIDETGLIVEWNQTNVEMTGLERSKVMGVPVWDMMMMTVTPERRTAQHSEAFKATVLEALKTGQSYLFAKPVEAEFYPQSSNEKRYLHQTIFPIKTEKGYRITSLTHDITERKRAEEEIRKLNQELEQRVIERTSQLESANKELEAFAYSVSHDLRAPLRHIDGFIEMLRNKTKTALDDQSRHYMEVIAASANKMGVLIDDLLSFSRMGRNEMFKSQMDLGELVQEVIQEFKLETENRHIQWQISQLPLVSGDRAMLRIVLVNLISNALKFTRPREIVQIEIGSEMKDEKEEIIFVRDNGVGFDMEYVDKLFGVFQRLHRQEDFEGTGIGLANVRRIISRHGGRTWAEGQIDHGATFYFSLPYYNQVDALQEKGSHG